MVITTLRREVCQVRLTALFFSRKRTLHQSCPQATSIIWSELSDKRSQEVSLTCHRRAPTHRASSAAVPGGRYHHPIPVTLPGSRMGDVMLSVFPRVGRLP